MAAITQLLTRDMPIGSSMVWNCGWLTIVRHLARLLVFRLVMGYFRDVMVSIGVWFCLLYAAMRLDWPVLLRLKFFNVVGNRGPFTNLMILYNIIPTSSLLHCLDYVSKQCCSFVE